MDSRIKKYIIPKNYLAHARTKRKKYRQNYQENIQPYLQWPAFLLHHPLGVQFFPRWRQHWQHPVPAVSEGLPWFTFPCISWLEKFLTPTMNVFEWGSGGSTIFIAPRVNQIISIEHDQEWYQRIQKEVEKRNLKNVQLILQPPDQSPTGQQQPTPFNFYSSDENFAGYSFEKYVKVIDDFSDQSFDLIIADGRARMSCLMRALPKIRLPGHVLLDDAQRLAYTAIRNELDHIPHKNFFGPTPYHATFKETMVWKIA